VGNEKVNTISIYLIKLNIEEVIFMGKVKASTIKRLMKQVTDEYKKPKPNRKKIGEWSEESGRLLAKYKEQGGKLIKV